MQHVKILRYCNLRFPARLISRNVDINCSLRSCDLTQLNYFLWSLLQSTAYVDKLTICKQVIKHFSVRLKTYKHPSGGHFNDVVLHI